MRTVNYLPLILLVGACSSVAHTDTQNADQPVAAKQVLAAGRHAIDFNNDAIAGYIAKLPAGYSAERTYPMIVAFHGAVGSAETAYRRWAESSAGFILISPQGKARMGWQIGRGQLHSILACIDDAQERFAVDADRVYATGHSMGGHVSWNLATFHAERFAAIAPTASKPMFVDELDRLLSVPLYVVHGRDDRIVDLAKNQQAEQYVNAHGGSLTLVVVEQAGHGFVADQRDDIIEFFNMHR